MRCVLAWLFAFATLVPAWGHIGTQNVFYEGSAGPYQVRVSVQPPPVVPGRAQINVRIHNQPESVRSVGVLPVRWDAGRKGAPPPDRAVPVKGEPGLFNTELWIMDFGAYSVFVDVEGDLGKGTAIVPFNSVSSRRLAMTPGMAAAFLAAGTILAGILICVVGAAFRESVLPPGMAPDALRSRRGRWGMAGACLVLALLLTKGNAWWNAVDRHFQNSRLYKTIEIPVAVEERDGQAWLKLTVAPSADNWRDRTPLVADHGKLMHLFLVADEGMRAFAHLHPEKAAEQEFRAAIPKLPAGNYTVYADINHESGLTQTLVGKVKLTPTAGNNSALEPDDSTWIAEPARVSGQLPLGGAIRPLGATSFRAGVETSLRFEALGSDGKPLPLEPYLGMWSHAVIRSVDGSVFTHLHPSGTISIASQELFARRERGEDLRKPIDVICGRVERELAFPFSFPQSGQYRAWVQVKSFGQVQTAAFDLSVQP